MRELQFGKTKERLQVKILFAKERLINMMVFTITAKNNHGAITCNMLLRGQNKRSCNINEEK